MDFPAYYRARGQLVRAGLRPITLALPAAEFAQVSTHIRRPGRQVHHLGGALVKLADRGDKCVLWGYDPHPDRARLVPFVIGSAL